MITSNSQFLDPGQLFTRAESLMNNHNLNLPDSENNEGKAKTYIELRDDPHLIPTTRSNFDELLVGISPRNQSMQQQNQLLVPDRTRPNTPNTPNELKRQGSEKKLEVDLAPKIILKCESLAEKHERSSSLPTIKIKKKANQPRSYNVSPKSKSPKLGSALTPTPHGKKPATKSKKKNSFTPTLVSRNDILETYKLKSLPIISSPKRFTPKAENTQAKTQREIATSTANAASILIQTPRVSTSDANPVSSQLTPNNPLHSRTSSDGFPTLEKKMKPDSALQILKLKSTKSGKSPTKNSAKETWLGEGLFTRSRTQSLATLNTKASKTAGSPYLSQNFH